MIPLEGASEELAVDLLFEFGAVALRMVHEGMVGCTVGELVDLRVGDRSSGG